MFVTYGSGWALEPAPGVVENVFSPLRDSNPGSFVTMPEHECAVFMLRFAHNCNVHYNVLVSLQNIISKKLQDVPFCRLHVLCLTVTINPNLCKHSVHTAR